MASREAVGQAYYLCRRAYPDHVERYQRAPGSAEELMCTWLPLLADLPDELLIAAAQAHVARSPWWPKVAELRQAALDLVATQTGAPLPGDAWYEVTQEIRRVGSYGRPRWSHPHIARTVDALGGWRYLCLSEDYAADRARFLQIYERYVARDREDAVMMLPAVRDQIRRLASEKRLALGAPVAGEAAS